MDIRNGAVTCTANKNSEGASDISSPHEALEVTTSTNTRSVGQAIHELALTEALSRSSAKLLPPGNGRSVIVIPEVAIGRGRPDMLFVTVSMTSLNAFLASGLKVETLTQARTLVEELIPTTGRRKKSMTISGCLWTAADLRKYSKAVVDSLAVEAKMKDWKQAIRQASRFRHLAHRAAIMLPDSVALDRAEPYLETYDLGFIAQSETHPTWGVRASKSELHPANALWLLELAARPARSRYLPRS